jgi:hypothetical protein
LIIQVNRLKAEGNNRWAGGPLLSVFSPHLKWDDWRGLYGSPPRLSGKNKAGFVSYCETKPAFRF